MDKDIRKWKEVTENMHLDIDPMDHDAGAHDHEASMARGQLYHIAKDALKLLDMINKFDIQFFLTGTDKNLFSFVSTNAQFYNISNI